MLIDRIKAILKAVPFLEQAVIRGRRLFRQARNRNLQRRVEHYCRYMAQQLPRPMFVKVGANDGITDDPCSRLLLDDRRWHGVLIEPVPYCFERLRANFNEPRFILEQVAVGATSGRTPFYYVDRQARVALPDLPGWYDQLGSFDRAHIVKHLAGRLEPYIVECLLEVETLASILARHDIPCVHLLHIDVEGHDLAILKTVDFAVPPWLILVEHQHLSREHRAEMHALLRQHGYSVLDCGADYLAARDDLLPPPS